MIKITLIKSGNIFLGFKTKGHANYDEKGHDIVCAAVSTLTQTCLKSLVEVADLKYKDIDYIVNEGDISGIIKDINNAKDERVQTLFKSMELGIKEIEKDFSKYLKVIYRGCTNV